MTLLLAPVLWWKFVGEMRAREAGIVTAALWAVPLTCMALVWELRGGE